MREGEARRACKHSEPMRGRGKEGGRKFIFYVGRKSPVYTLQLSQKSDFQLSTTKSDNIGHPTVKTGQIWPLGWF